MNTSSAARSSSAPFWIATAAVTLIALYLSWISGAAGHGDYVIARLLLPLACVMISLNPTGSVVALVAVLEWPAYALVLRRAAARRKSGFASITIVFVHAVAAVVCFTVLATHFN